MASLHDLATEGCDEALFLKTLRKQKIKGKLSKDKTEYHIDKKSGSDKQTPLHMAAYNGHFMLVYHLLTFGADPNARDNEDWTPLHCAANQMHLEICSLLLTRGADPNSSNKEQTSVLHYLIRSPYSEELIAVLDLMIENGAMLDLKNKYDATPLHQASTKGLAESVRFLVDHKSDVNVADKFGETALHKAVIGAHYDAALILLKNGADPNIAGKQGTPYQLLQTLDAPLLNKLFEGSTTNGLSTYGALSTKGPSSDSSNEPFRRKEMLRFISKKTLVLPEDDASDTPEVTVDPNLVFSREKAKPKKELSKVEIIVENRKKREEALAAKENAYQASQIKEKEEKLADYATEKALQEDLSPIIEQFVGWSLETGSSENEMKDDLNSTENPENGENSEKPLLGVSLDSAQSFLTPQPLSKTKNSALSKSIDGFTIDDRVQNYPLDFVPSNYKHWFHHNPEHLVYMGSINRKGKLDRYEPIVVIFIAEESLSFSNNPTLNTTEKDSKKSHYWRIIFWSPKYQVQIFTPMEVNEKKRDSKIQKLLTKKSFVPEEVLSSLQQKILSQRPKDKEVKINLQRIKSTVSVRDSLLEFEMYDPLRPKCFSVGVLYAKKDQEHEDLHFNNQHSSPAFEEFLEFLGDKILLDGWKGHRGDMDVKGTSTGKYSLYRRWKGFEIMFHVSTYLPYTEGVDQQMHRKRRIGNDIGVIVFQEGGAYPGPIRSQFLNCYYAVSPCASNSISKSITHYKINVQSGPGVPEFGPRLPPIPIAKKDLHGRDFLLTKVINGHLAALRAPALAEKIWVRPKEAFLTDLIKKECTNKSILNSLETV